MTKRALIGLTAIGVCLVSSFALAAELDVVLLKSGGRVQGTVIEDDPQSGVNIRLADGTNKKISREQILKVRYADDATDAPPPVAPPPKPHSETELRFHADDEHVTLHEVTGSAYAVASYGGYSGYGEAHSFEAICAAPCVVTTRSGPHEFALSQDDGKPIIVHERMNLRTGRTNLLGHYDSHAGLRGFGITLALLSIVGGTALMLLPIFKGDFNNFAVPLGAGAAIMLVGGTIGIVLARTSDGATIEVASGVPRFKPLVAAPEAARLQPSLDGGLSLRGSF